MSSQIPHLIQGNIAVDDRGSLFFVNDFSLRDLKRFYVVSNHRLDLFAHGTRTGGRPSTLQWWKAQPLCALSTLTTGTLQIETPR
jgi:hypothetical protein